MSSSKIVSIRTEPPTDSALRRFTLEVVEQEAMSPFQGHLAWIIWRRLEP